MIYAETELQRKVCQYVRTHYRDAIFRSDFASGLHLTMRQAAQHKRLQSGRAWPDFVLYEPSHDAKHALLALELKASGVSIYKRDGTLRSDRHLEEQAEMIRQLRERGYAADFAVGLEDAIAKIDAHMGRRKEVVEF